MSNRIFIIGGGGQIGRAVALKFLTLGWNVISSGRKVPSEPINNDRIRYVTVDRHDTRRMREAISPGVDLLLDCLSFDESDSNQLVELQDLVGRICVISSASVYMDDQGRTLDEASDFGFPDFGGPLNIDHRIVEPGPATYSTRKVAMELRLLSGAAEKSTILRPCAIYGPHSKHAREWFFVKRLLDGRKQIPLAYEGKTRFHTTSVKHIAQAVAAAIESATPSTMNVVDPQAPTTREIGEAIMSAAGVYAEIIGLPVVDEYPPSVGANPWGLKRDMICVVSNAYSPIGEYGDLIKPTIDWLMSDLDLVDWKSELPVLAAYPFSLFDYEKEDELLRDL